LSKRPLQEPIVSCALGKLYNKDAIIEFLLNRSAYGDGEEICGHVKSLKDVTDLKLTHNTAQGVVDVDADSGRPRPAYICPLNLKEMTGSTPFVYITSCGCVFSSSGLKAMSTPVTEGDAKPDEKTHACPKCATKYDKSAHVRTINPIGEEAEKMREAMLAQKAAAAALKPKKRKAVATDAEAAEPKRSRLAPNQAQSGDQTVAAVAKKVAASLAEEEKRRKGAMSPAVASLYQAKNPNAKQTFTTMGTFTRYA